MKWIFRGLGIAAIVVLAFFLFGYVTMYLWNWLMPYLFHLPEITFKMAIGLVILSKILFGGFRGGRGGHWGRRKYWKAKWESMTPEEREQFKTTFAERCRHKWGRVEVKVEKNA
jgi:Ca2+/H+ antiporter, TMEM165/GDT1 family